jgi:large subunit ribosomal protein L35Ae
MKVTLLSYRRGRHTQTPNQILIGVEGCESKAMASRFIGKRVMWRSVSGREIFGRITQPHGTKGVLRARFTRGLPGYAMGKKAEILD